MKIPHEAVYWLVILIAYICGLVFLDYAVQNKLTEHEPAKVEQQDCDD